MARRTLRQARHLKHQTPKLRHGPVRKRSARSPQRLGGAQYGLGHCRWQQAPGSRAEFSAVVALVADTLSPLLTSLLTGKGPFVVAQSTAALLSLAALCVVHCNCDDGLLDSSVSDTPRTIMVCLPWFIEMQYYSFAHFRAAIRIVQYTNDVSHALKRPHQHERSEAH